MTNQQFAVLMEHFASKSAAPPPNRRQSPPFVPPTNAAPGESILNHFPTISRSIVLEVIWHEIVPLNLYKLDVNATEKAAEAKNLVDFEEGNITIKQRMGRVKDYPTFASLLDPLLVYFNILDSMRPRLVRHMLF